MEDRTDGRDVLTRIKTDQHLRGIPVVILTTSSTAPDILPQQGQRKGMRTG